ncbi:Tyrosine-protein kinase Dnt, partial [Geodia barretti]
MWEVFSGGKAPYPGTDPHTLIQSLEEGYRMHQPYNDACNEEIYGIMKQCWQMMPEERPTFTELYFTVSNIIERMAGYLQVGYNPFLGRGDEEKAEEMEEEEEEEEKEEKENN